MNITATTEATANTIVTSSTITYDGVQAVFIQFACPAMFLPSGVGLTCDLWLYEKVGAGAAASIGKLAEYINVAAQSWETPGTAFFRKTPSAAAVIYSVRGSTSSGTSIAAGGAGGTATAMPGFIRITAV